MQKGMGYWGRPGGLAAHARRLAAGGRQEGSDRGMNWRVSAAALGSAAVDVDASRVGGGSQHRQHGVHRVARGNGGHGPAAQLRGQSAGGGVKDVHRSLHVACKQGWVCRASVVSNQRPLPTLRHAAAGAGNAAAGSTAVGGWVGGGAASRALTHDDAVGRRVPAGPEGKNPPAGVVVVADGERGCQLATLAGALPYLQRVLKGGGHDAAGACTRGERRKRGAGQAAVQRGGAPLGAAGEATPLKASPVEIETSAPSGANAAPWQPLECCAVASGLSLALLPAAPSARRSHTLTVVSVEAVANNCGAER